MKNKSSNIGVIVLTIIITSVVVGGGLFLLQKNSIKELREEIKNSQKTENKKTTTTKDAKTPETVDKTSAVKTKETESSSSSPADVEWLTYSDKDITFKYPKTFLGTSLQEDFDQNLGRKQWEVIRQGDTIYIKPNFESPAAEFGSTYEITVFKDTWAAEEGWSTAAQLHQGPESQWGEKLLTTETGYYVGVLRNLDFGLGQIADVYTLIPGGINGLGRSKKPTEKHFIIHAYPNIYKSYVEDILIPSIQAK